MYNNDELQSVTVLNHCNLWEFMIFKVDKKNRFAPRISETLRGFLILMKRQ